ncbi:hypothetical protein EVAR_61238_1 [Eumeta japonica]|uniref:Uncharacterized protein n=1 Tax=Eumeta variegata TaxID=151549 RepID=A0A4C1Z951_EUMVA|nr:hypothetical protein EVAR_61238_1 [Eumeta japonica]
MVITETEPIKDFLAFRLSTWAAIALGRVQSEENIKPSKRMFSVVQDVLESWKLWKILYQASVDDIGGTPLSRSIIVIFWSLKSQICEVLLCIAYHRVSDSIVKTKKACLFILATHTEKEPFRRPTLTKIHLKWRPPAFTVRYMGAQFKTQRNA